MPYSKKSDNAGILLEFTGLSKEDKISDCNQMTTEEKNQDVIFTKYLTSFNIFKV